MAVFTEVPHEAAARLVRGLGLGELTRLDGIEGGIENTNYFATTDRGEYVLTLFERLDASQLPFYLELMRHLAHHGVPAPDPAPDAAGALIHPLCGKPAAVVTRLAGHSVLAPGPAHCAQLGSLQARMHLAGRDFEREQPNLRSLAWWNQIAPTLKTHLTDAQVALLQSELAFQNHVAASAAYAALPRGPVHADLFRDNVLFDDGDAVGGGSKVDGATLTGVFDFYFAGTDTWLFDLAVALNDWCVHPATGEHDAPRAHALLAAYEAVRPLADAERRLLPAMTRAAALRFWLSRLWDVHRPREAKLLNAHDPAHFERVLRERVRMPPFAPPTARTRTAA